AWGGGERGGAGGGGSAPLRVRGGGERRGGARPLAGGRAFSGWTEQGNGPADSASPEQAGGGGEPRAAIGVEERRQRLEDAGVIAVEPGGLLPREPLGRHQSPGGRGRPGRLRPVRPVLRARGGP